MKKGFTLIELLVVVLIIGILASVALPKYQVAVRKSRLATIWQLGRAIKEAEEIFYMANGRYTTDMEELDISVPYVSARDNGDSENYRFYDLADGTHIKLFLFYGSQPRLNIFPQRNNLNQLIYNVIELYYDNTSYKGRQSCAAYPNDTLSVKACLALGGKPQPPSTGAQVFVLE